MVALHLGRRLVGPWKDSRHVGLHCFVGLSYAGMAVLITRVGCMTCWVQGLVIFLASHHSGQLGARVVRSGLLLAAAFQHAPDSQRLANSASSLPCRSCAAVCRCVSSSPLPVLPSGSLGLRGAALVACSTPRPSGLWACGASWREGLAVGWCLVGVAVWSCAGTGVSLALCATVFCWSCGAGYGSAGHSAAGVGQPRPQPSQQPRMPRSAAVTATPAPRLPSTSPQSPRTATAPPVPGTPGIRLHSARAHTLGLTRKW